ncbi:MAG: FHA domain-containing protein [Chamaesiphon sp.]|nr:FHA domain-containing protein [Chamaesiphon sp.]
MKIKICNAATLVELKEFDLASAIRIHGECFVGRSPDVPLVLDSDDVSRQHGKFFIQDEKYHFCDLGSSNGSVINDRIVEPNRSYSLNNGDAVHIGNFVLLVEEHQQELAQTVFKVIDPWMFKPKPPEIVVSNPSTEVPIPEPVASAVEINNPEEIDALPPAVAAVEAATLNPVNEPIVQTDYSVTEPVEEIEAESIDLIETVDEVTPNISAEVPPFDPSTQTIVQAGYSVAAPVGEAKSTPVIDLGDRDNLIVINIELEPLPFDPSTQTIVQRGDPESPPVETSIEPVVVVADGLSANVEAYIPALTISDPVENEDITLNEAGISDETSSGLGINPIVEAEGNLPVSTDVELVADEVISLDDEVDILLANDAEQTEEPDNSTILTVETASAIEGDLQQASDEEVSFDFDDEVDTISTVDELNRAEEVLTPIVTTAATTPTIKNTLPAEDGEISFDDDGVDITTTIDDLNRVEEVELSTVETAETAPSIDNAIQAGLVAGVATVAAVSNFDRTEEIAQSTVIEEEIMPVETASPTDSIRQSAIDSLSTKQIIAICHDSITPDLIDFIDAHQSFFAKCSLVSWLSISQELNQQTGINLSQAIPPGMSGGYQRIAASINSGDVIAVIFLRDFLQPQAGQTNEESMLRLCNINQILLATNTATAAAIVSYLS